MALAKTQTVTQKGGHMTNHKPNHKPQAFRLDHNLQPVPGGYSAIPHARSRWVEVGSGRVVSRQPDTKPKGKKNPLS